MGRIVSVVVVDMTRPVDQEGFKSVGLFDFTQTKEVEVITDTKTLSSGNALYDTATAYFANGGGSLIVSGAEISTASTEIAAHMAKVLETNPYYGIIAVVPKSNQTEYYKEIKKFAEGNKKLAVLELNGNATEVQAVVADYNSDRVVAYANSNDTQKGLAGAVTGVCMPQDEGSITWGNKAVTGVPTSGYKASDEQTLLGKNINYITKEKGLVITQFGRTTSGSNADITRSKDWLENRCAEALTAALVNNKKIPFTTQGMAMISSALNQVGVQAVNMGMLDRFVVVTPKVSEIPTNDKANRVLRGVKFIATLSGAIETIEMELQVRLD